MLLFLDSSPRRPEPRAPPGARPRRLVSCYLFPWLVFHFWLSLLSLAAHTAPHLPWRPEGEGYDLGRAAVCGTVTLRLPRPLELLLNDANYTLPLMVAPDLPFYHAREAYGSMRERLLPYLTEADLSLKLITNHITKWQVYDEEMHSYMPLDEAVREVEAAIAQALGAEAAEEGAEQAGQEGHEGQEPGGVGASAAYGAGHGCFKLTTAFDHFHRTAWRVALEPPPGSCGSPKVPGAAGRR
ncbi:Omega-6 fatty acid desaturase, chloroplastic [Tetrabaena socialis]|uniref:Omega-6 fatty acid desaturase, chloroplastic n=1 Tax=Tetrabaena socialis TaxID=47790 RepID=A0A2J8A7I5_9CHLO|nr:Omega-6 fatty acid desaturase, chloroplastic [Tetrabaena socialis]|eukprot:PNH08494.1 Omega-6 fatty acid desaturase, chloroplastic [Tetrabaena socialis]